MIRKINEQKIFWSDELLYNKVIEKCRRKMFDRVNDVFLNESERFLDTWFEMRSDLKKSCRKGKE